MPGMSPAYTTTTCLLLTFAALGASGCAEECTTPDFALNGKSWNVFNTVVAFDPPTIDPAFPGESSPANGAHVMGIDWNTVGLESGVTVRIDEQEFAGQGSWDDVECGNFRVTFEGTYYPEGDEEGPVSHDFTAVAVLQTWEGHLEGYWKLVEVWRNRDMSGKMTFDVQMVGTP